MSSTLNFDQTNGLPAVRITEVGFDYPAGASEISVRMRVSEVLRDAAGVEHAISGDAPIITGTIATSSLGEMIPLHDIRTGEHTGQTIAKGAIVAAINSLCREIIEAQA